MNKKSAASCGSHRVIAESDRSLPSRLQASGLRRVLMLAAGVIISCPALPAAGVSAANPPVEVKTPLYRIVIDPAKGGRITEWKLTGSEQNLAHAGLGISAVSRTDMAQVIGFDLPLSAEVVRTGGQTEVILSTLPGDLEIQGNLSCRKKYTFRDDTPVVQVQVELTNHSAGGIVGWRLYNEIATSPAGKAAVFQEREDTAARTQEVWADNNPGDARKWNILDSAGSGWGGVDTGLGQTVFFWTAPAGVAAIYNYASPDYAAYEIRMQGPVDRGETITRTFFLTTVATDQSRTALNELKSKLPPDLAGMVAAGVATSGLRKVQVEHKVERTEGKDNQPPQQSDQWLFGGPSGLQVGYSRYLNQPPQFTGQYPSLTNSDMGVGFDGGVFGNWYRGNAIRVLVNGKDIFAQKPAAQYEAREGVNGYLRLVWELEKGGALTLNFTIPEDGHAIYARAEITPGELSVTGVQVQLLCFPGGFGPAYGGQSHRQVTTAKGKWEVPPDFKPGPDKPYPEAPLEKGAEWVFYADKLESKGSLGLLVNPDEAPAGKVRMSNYGQYTDLDYPADTRQIHLAFFAFGADNETSYRQFLAALKTEQAALGVGPYWPDAAQERMASQSAVLPDIEFKKDADRILLVGRTGRYRFYRVETALTGMGFAGKIDVAHLNYNTLEKGTIGFPVSPSGIASYRMIVFIDTPYFYLPPASWQLAERFVTSGGTLVFVGDHAVGGYQGSNIGRLLPVDFDYSKIAKGTYSSYLNDRAPYTAFEQPVAEDRLTGGLDFSAPPQVSVYRSKAKPAARVLLSAGGNPVLSCRPAGKGRIYSMPVCLTPNYHAAYDVDLPEYEGSSVIPIKAEPPGERAKSIFFWGGYDNLWQRLAMTAVYGQESVLISEMKATREDDGRTLQVVVSLSADAKVKSGSLTVYDADGAGRQVPLKFSDGRGQARVNEVSVTATIKYKADVVLATGRRLLQWGLAPAAKAPAFRIVVGDHQGLCRILRRGYPVPVSIEFVGATAGDVTLSLVDPWGKTVWTENVRQEGKSVLRTVPTEGLAYGKYTVAAESGGEAQKATIHILPDYEYKDRFFILGAGSSSDDPEEQFRDLKATKEDGANLISTTANWYPDPLRWPARWSRELGERVMLSGLEPAHSDVTVVGGWSSPAHLSDEDLDKSIRVGLEDFNRIWGMAPRGVPTYVFDEPGHYDFVKDCKTCNAEYLKRYGGTEVPKEKDAPGHYRLAAIMDQAASDGFVRKAQLWHKQDVKSALVPWGITNEGSGLLGHAVGLARGWGGYGMDLFSYSPGNWKAQYAYDIALAAVDYNPFSLGYAPEAGSFYGGTPIAAQRGQAMYSALARGARLIQWYDWDWTRINSRLGIMPERFAAVKRASLEALQIGPVLAGMRRPQGRMALLVPTAPGDENGLRAAYKAAQVSCGNVDFLYYQHLREEKLNEYNLMLLAGNEKSDDEILKIIMAWVDKGGTLLVMPRSLMSDAVTLQPPSSLAASFPFTYGKALADVKVEGIPGSPAYAWELTSTGGSARYHYADGKPASITFKHGTGRMEVFSFIPGSARGLEQIFRDIGIDPWIARSDDEDASAWLLKSGEGYYAVAVNSENTGRTMGLRLRTEFKTLPIVYDMLTGQKQPAKIEGDGVVLLEVKLEPFWGRAFALLPAEPVKLNVTVAAPRVKAGSAAECEINITGRDKLAISARLPIEVKVTDASGSLREEYSGARVLDNGQLLLPLALGTNDPTGQWRIEVQQPWTGLKGQAVFRVEN